MVISTGTMPPAWEAVRTLYSLTKAMMLTPCWPRAGPTGGAGVAWPAGICNLTNPVTCFLGAAISSSLYLPVNLAGHDLQEVQLNRGGASKDRHHDLDFLALQIHFRHKAREIGKRPIGHLDRITDLVGNLGDF